MSSILSALANLGLYPVFIGQLSVNGVTHHEIQLTERQMRSGVHKIDGLLGITGLVCAYLVGFPEIRHTISVNVVRVFVIVAGLTHQFDNLFG